MRPPSPALRALRASSLTRPVPARQSGGGACRGGGPACAGQACVFLRLQRFPLPVVIAREGQVTWPVSRVDGEGLVKPVEADPLLTQAEQQLACLGGQIGVGCP